MAEDANIREREEERAHALAAIDAALTGIRREGREPDEWEIVDLAGAIASVSRGLYRLAAVQADRALTPIAQRSPAPVQRDKSLEHCNLELLYHALDYVRTEPVMPFPIFGKIEFR